MQFPHIDLLYSGSGLAVGFLVGLTGVGGGSLMTPLLVLLFGIHPATAVGTDLLYAAATKATGTVVHGIKGSVDWRITGRLAAGSVPATVATLFLLHRYGLTTPAAASTGRGRRGASRGLLRPGTEPAPHPETRRRHLAGGVQTTVALST